MSGNFHGVLPPVMVGNNCTYSRKSRCHVSKGNVQQNISRHRQSSSRKHWVPRKLVEGSRKEPEEYAPEEGIFGGQDQFLPYPSGILSGQKRLRLSSAN